MKKKGNVGYAAKQRNRESMCGRNVKKGEETWQEAIEVGAGRRRGRKIVDKGIRRRKGDKRREGIKRRRKKIRGGRDGKKWERIVGEGNRRGRM